MVGTAGSGFLNGFVNTALVLQQLQQKKEAENHWLGVQKETLGLRRKALEGQIASRTLQDRIRQANLERLLRDLGARQPSTAVPQGPEGGTLPFGTDTETTPPVPGGTPAPAAPAGPLTEQFLRDYGSKRQQPTAQPGANMGSTDAASQPGNRAAMYNRLLEQIGQNDGMAPQVIRHAQALIQPESNLDPDAVSRKGATGLMQLMPDTATRYGVEDPLNPLQNLRGGLRYLQDLYTMFPGRPDLVTAAYNAGESAVKAAGKAVPNYPETQALVKKVGATFQATPRG